MTSTSRLPARIDAVVIGTSAGGIEALSAILPALPAGSGVAVFVVLHLPRDRPSLLVEIFAPKCRLAVREAEDKEPIVYGTVYFAPNNYHMLVERDLRIALSVDDLVHHSRPSIDVLFESAAQAYGDRLLGILLTGANQDGARGLATIHALGGTTVVQEPATARSPQMVNAALNLTTPTHVAPLESIAGMLAMLGPDPVR